MWRTAFPDFHFQIEDAIAENNLVAVNLVFTGTYKGQWQDMPPSGNKILVEEMMFFRFEQVKIVGIWEVFEEFEMRNQIRAQAERSD
jgi:predicted ester cyclase